MAISNSYVKLPEGIPHVQYFSTQAADIPCYLSHQRLGLIKEPEKFVEVEEIAYRGVQMSHHVSPRTQSMLRMHCFHTLRTKARRVPRCHCPA